MCFSHVSLICLKVEKTYENGNFLQYGTNWQIRHFVYLEDYKTQNTDNPCDHPSMLNHGTVFPGSECKTFVNQTATLSPVENNNLAVLAVWGPEYEISLDMKVNTWPDSSQPTASVLWFTDLTSQEDSEEYQKLGRE